MISSWNLKSYAATWRSDPASRRWWNLPEAIGSEWSQVYRLPSGVATENKPAAAEDAKIDLFEDDDEFEEFEIDQGIGMADGAHNELEGLGGLTTSIGQLNIENTSLPSTRGDQNDIQDDGSDNFWFEDDLSNDILDDDSSHASVLNREGRCRLNKNHTMGYRFGITAGKEASAQEGFNVGFRQSVHVGYRWGLVRGITSALAGLSDSSKEKLVKKFENRERFLNLDKSVQAISANDSLKMYYNSILQNGSVHSQDHSEGDQQVASLTDEDSNSNKSENLYKDLISLLNDASEINVNAIKT
ncbi:uncharacterized protein LOC103714664 [Phoenix dactylifera]|uniref:Uncharacterized protein LOC103714664 n=1 Tax=Phoenix dactylifera TaxID=42345 RepID=A0A8B9AY17_PHODC|nr:uncharacterized protein LOC103714664 [Phoenix dactylifera]